MINLDDKIGGFAILCKENGLVKEILRDDIGLTSEATLGKLFTNLVDKENRRKAMNFMLDIRASEVAFNYQMNVWLDGKLSTLSFIGIRMKDEILVIGAKNEEDAIEFTNQLQKINNEQANLIRKLMKEKSQFQNRQTQDKERSFEDLTMLNNELINLQRELAKKNAELERLNEMKNRFLGMAAHDLRNPLAIIQSYSEYLVERSSSYLPEKHAKFLRTIYSTTQFMLNLIEDLLDISKIESGKLHLNKDTFDFIRFANYNIDLNTPLANKKNIDIELITEEQNIPITADRHKIEQVFNNLINNAIKFSYPDSVITVSINKENDYVVTSVSDKGMGIPEKKMESIFQPFQKGNSRGTDGEQGTGLGLVIVKRIVEGHQGKIWIDSEEEKGTSVSFKLPCCRHDEETTKTDTEKTPQENKDWSDQEILLIEDDPVSLKFIEELFQTYKLIVHSAKNGEEGIKLYQQNSGIKMIFLDLSLPDANGFELIKEFRKRDSKLPIIIETAHVMSGEKEKALMNGASDYITKPINQNTIFQLLHKYLD